MAEKLEKFKYKEILTSTKLNRMVDAINGNLTQVHLVYDGTKIYNDADETKSALNYTAIYSLVSMPTNWVFLEYRSAYYIPGYLKDESGRAAVAFGSFSISGIEVTNYVVSINDNNSIVGKIIVSASRSLVTDIADNFSQYKDYPAGSFTNYNGILVRFKEAHRSGALRDSEVDIVNLNTLMTLVMGLSNSKADKSTTLSGYGITDAYTKSEVDSMLNTKANSSTSLSGYGITDAYTKDEVNANFPTKATMESALSGKADKDTTLAGYGITNAYTKSEVDTALSGKASKNSVDTLNGDATTPGSVKYIVAQEIAKVIASAPEEFDTLKEIADWIASDATRATELANRVTAVEQNKADKDTTLAGYGITDAYTKGEIDAALENKVNKAITLAGYGITDAYTKSEVDNALNELPVKAHTHPVKINDTVYDIPATGATPVYLGSYLPLTGGTVSSTSTDEPLKVDSSQSSGSGVKLPFQVSQETKGGVGYSLEMGMYIYLDSISDSIYRMGLNSSGTPYIALGTEIHKIYHSGNLTDVSQLTNDVNYIKKSDADSAYQPKSEVINHGTSDTEFTLTPNKFHVWGAVPALTLTLGESTSNILDEFMFQFTCPYNALTVLSLPSSVKWYNDFVPTMEKGRTYQASIVNNIIILGSV